MQEVSRSQVSINKPVFDMDICQCLCTLSKVSDLAGLLSSIITFFDKAIVVL